MKQISKLWNIIDPHSLQVRLTIGIAVVSALGLGSLATWTSWKMREILINSHQYSIEEIAKRLPQDVQLYSEMMPPETALKKSIDNLTSTNTFLWIKNPEDEIIAKSENWHDLSDAAANQLMSLSEISVKLPAYQFDQNYFVVYSDSFPVQGRIIGNLFVVRDVTREQTMFLVIVRSLVIGSVFVITTISLAIAFYIQRSLQPLRQLSQMTSVISVNDLGQAQIYLDHAPSEVKELAETYNKMLSRLSQSWEQERQFVSNVSHELRTPLTIVQGYLQSVLRRQNNLTPTQKEALETAAVEAEHISRLLQDLLDLARADSGYLHLRKEPHVLKDLVTEIVGMAKNCSGRQIKIESMNQPIEVKVDSDRFKQVLLNLIDNAIKYSESGTPVTIKLSQQKDEAIVQVCDQGYGIPLQHQSRIFERFYRIDEARTRSTGGCGLGLSIVKTLVEGMGGNVTVRSCMNEGSVFTITLPTYQM